MDSGSSKAFDFASDDILCSYEDYTNQDNPNGNHSDSAIATNSSKEFHKSRMSSRPSFPTSSYSPPDDSGNQDVIIAAVERSMKKHSENLMRFLEGISSRLSQLELYCYNIDKSVGEMRSDLARDNGEADAKLKFLEKHIQEVHRSVQIIRDKQELADTQKELAKLQLAQKDSSSAHDSQKSEETSTPSSDTKRNDNTADTHNQQLALALPHQVTPPPAPQPQMPPQPMTQPQMPPQPMSQPQMPPQPMSQPQTYYLPPAQLPNIPPPNQITQNHYLQPDPHYQTPPQPPRPQGSQPQPQMQPQPQPQYQQQWAQQVPPQVQPPQSAVRPSSPQVFPPLPYLPSQQANPPPPETLTNSMPYAFGGPGRSNQQPPPQHFKPAYGGPPNDGYASGGPQGNASYMIYDSEGGRVPHPSHPSNFPQSVYPPNPQQSGSGGGNMMARPPPQFMRNHPYNELIDKLGSMGYRTEHVMSVIQRLEESGQTVDFNTVLDRLNR